MFGVWFFCVGKRGALLSQLVGGFIGMAVFVFELEEVIAAVLTNCMCLWRTRAPLKLPRPTNTILTSKAILERGLEALRALINVAQNQKCFGLKGLPLAVCWRHCSRLGRASMFAKVVDFLCRSKPLVSPSGFQLVALSQVHFKLLNVSESLCH